MASSDQSVSLGATAMRTGGWSNDPTSTKAYVPGLILVMTVAGGCMMYGSGHEPIVDRDPPLVSGGEQATASRRLVVGIDFRPYHIFWHGRGLRKWETAAVARRAIEYLRKRGVWEFWEIDRLPEEHTRILTHRAKFVICLNPLIVLGPTDVVLAAIRPLESTETRPRDPPAGPPPTRRCGMSLGNYLFAGTHVPYVDGIKWFSPDLRRGPELLTNMQVSENEYHIPVRWGTVVVTREGDHLIVTGQPRSE